MPGKRPPRLALPPIRSLDDDAVRADLLVLQPTTTGTRLPGVDQIGVVRLDELAFEHQPRELVPEEVLQGLIAAGQAMPAPVLAALEEAARADPYYAGILAELRGLAASIDSEGVLQPIRVVHKAGRLVVRDGHRRCLASLLARRETIPAQRVEEPDELAAVAHPLIVNLQRSDLTAVEKGAALLRLALAVGRRLAEEAGVDPGEVTIEALIGTSAANAEPEGEGVTAPAGDASAAVESSHEDSTGPAPSAGRTITGLSRDLAARVRDRVCAMTGLGRGPYYSYLALNRLTPAARAAGRGLTEGQLRAVVPLPPPVQADVVAFAVRRGLNSKEVASLAQVAREGDRDRLHARIAHLEGIAPKRRTAVSWEGLLYAVPRDFDRRCQALAAELDALEGTALEARVQAIREQVQLLGGLQDRFRTLIRRHGDRIARRDDPGDDGA